MTCNYGFEMQQQVEGSLKLLKDILGADLLGVYLFGSSLVGGLQKYSDIDLFVVTHRATTLEEKSRFIAALLKISGIYMKDTKRPLEITLVEKTMINPWQYPPRFDFQYGEWLRASFEKGIVEPWETHEMPDLALIVTQVSICIGAEGERWDDISALTKSCAEFMINKIKLHISLIHFDDPNKLIKLAEEPFSGDSSVRSG